MAFEYDSIIMQALHFFKDNILTFYQFSSNL